MTPRLRIATVLLLCAALVGGITSEPKVVGQAEEASHLSATGSVPTGTTTGTPSDAETASLDMAGLKPWGLKAGAVLVLAGDSIASGEGGRAYQTGTDLPRNRCHRSAYGLGRDLFGPENVVNVACSRATIEDFYTSHQADEWAENPPAPQLDQIADAGADVTLVLVGANDIGFPNLLNKCVLELTDCSQDTQLATETTEHIQSLGTALDKLYAAVRGVATGQVWIPAYPQLLNGTEDCGRLTVAERAFGSSVIEELNRQIEHSVDTVNQSLAVADRLVFIAGTATALSGHGACSSAPWVHSVGSTDLLSALSNQSRAQEILHPTKYGYEALTKSFSGQ